MKTIKQADTKRIIRTEPKKDSPDTMRLPKALKEKILQQAAKEKRSFSSVVITILTNYYERRNDKA
ncbi:MAG: hypothetical protein INR73_28845 [Williamsia sp.]|nr:hypothetical protein [Williamsia sp.]